MWPVKIWRRFRRYIGYRRRGVPKEVLKNVGLNFVCGHGAFFRPNEDIKIGSNVFMGINVHVAGPCVIKNDVMIASRVAFVGGDHGFKRAGVLMNAGRNSSDSVDPIIIEEDVWIGHGSIILAGSRIQRGSIIAAGSIVIGEIPPCTIWGGGPARFIRNRFSTEAEKILHLKYLEKRYEKI